jgi:hypothetical protein
MPTWGSRICFEYRRYSHSFNDDFQYIINILLSSINTLLDGYNPPSWNINYNLNKQFDDFKNMSSSF